MILESILTLSRLNAIIVESIIILIVSLIVFVILNNFREHSHSLSDKVIFRITFPLSLGLILSNALIRLLLEVVGLFTSFLMFGMLQWFLLLTIHLQIYRKTYFRRIAGDTIDFHSQYARDYSCVKWVSIGVGLIFQSIRIIENLIDTTLINDRMEDNFSFSLIVLVISFSATNLINTLRKEKKRMASMPLKMSSTLSFFLSYAIWGLIILVYGVIMQEAPFYIYGHIFLIVLYVMIFIVVGKIFSDNEHKRIEEELLTQFMKKQEISKKKENQEEDVILRVSNLKTYFYTEEGIVRAVEDVSFDIHNKEILGLVGETGCGKSVTALSILQLVHSPGKILNGSVQFQGVDLLQLSEESILEYRGNQITMIFQDPLNSINPVMKVGDQIAEVYHLHRQDELAYLKKNYEEKVLNLSAALEDIDQKMHQSSDRAIKQQLKETRDKNFVQIETYRSQSSIFMIARAKGIELLKNVGIPDPERIFDNYPHELSGGMRQRIMIAMGLACSPKLLLADEPTTALDVTIQMQILELIKDLRVKYQTSILFITHDLGVISQICDRVAVMYSGYIVEYGDVRTLFTQPFHPYTQGLIQAIPKVGEKKDELAMIPGMVPNLIYPPNGCRFHPRCQKCFDPCDKVVPRQIEVAPNHFVSCHLYDPQYTNSEATE